MSFGFQLVILTFFANPSPSCLIVLVAHISFRSTALSNTRDKILPSLCLDDHEDDGGAKELILGLIKFKRKTKSKSKTLITTTHNDEPQ